MDRRQFQELKEILKKNVPEDWKREEIYNKMFKPGYANWTKASGNYKVHFEFMRTSSLVWE